MRVQLLITPSPLGDVLSRIPARVLNPEDEELARKTASLADLEAQLADRELELASLRADLVHFEKRYLQTVGRRYAELDDLKAKLAEAQAWQQPHSPDAREKARQARTQAQESAWAAGEANAETPSPNDAASAEKPARSESLTELYRQAAKTLTLQPNSDRMSNASSRQYRIVVNVLTMRCRKGWGRITRPWIQPIFSSMILSTSS